MSKLVVISLGGSVIVPDDIDIEFLKSFRSSILKYLDRGRRFFIVAGGGRICRVYQDAAKEIADLTDEDVDWLGIHVTHLNAHLLRTIFRDHAHIKVLTHYDQKEEILEPIVVGGGWKPGHSTDLDSVMFAKLYGADTVINLSNIAFVYNKDPSKFPDAKPIKEISWPDFRKIVGEVWVPGNNQPFDPIASKEAENAGIKVVVMDGKDLDNFENYLAGKSFAGTIIS